MSSTVPPSASATDPRPIVQDQAFGIVPIFAPTDSPQARWEVGDRPDVATFQYLLIQHHAGHWAFPKGHADPGETPLQTAQREFEEETGIRDYTVIPTISFTERYEFLKPKKDRLVQKTVTYFPAWVHTQTVALQASEIQNHAWLDFERAIAQINYEANRAVLHQVRAFFQSPNIPTTTLELR